jgi:hypothetical protein
MLLDPIDLDFIFQSYFWNLFYTTFNFSGSRLTTCFLTFHTNLNSVTFFCFSQRSETAMFLFLQLSSFGCQMLSARAFLD